MTSRAEVKLQLSGFQRGTAEPKMGSTPPKAMAAMAKNGTTKRATSQMVPGSVRVAQSPWASALLPWPRATSAGRDAAVGVGPELVGLPRQRVEAEPPGHVLVRDEGGEQVLRHELGRGQVLG